MRRIHADWEAVDAALAPHQRRTLREYAAARGIAEDSLWEDPVVCTMGVALAVDAALAAARARGEPVERRALLQAAVKFDVDIETLLRRQRRRRRLREADI
ncbi:MAG: hypothetical protein AMXMBFR53_02370 [Gemmatimonadota bacterium]